MAYNYKWKTYYQDKPKSYDAYMPTYRQYNAAKPTSTYTPSQYSDRLGAYANEIKSARGDLDRTIANKPGAYNSQYNDRINDLIDRISGRKFQYDAANDSAYQLMKENYMNLGRQAAADTAGQAAALTGGYGNSYGTVAANQAYQGYLNQLNDRIPELQQMALQMYQQEGNDLQNQYNMLSDRDIAAYQKYRDTVGDWQNDRAYYDATLNNLRSMNQNVWGQNEQNRYNANQQAWDIYTQLMAMNDSNYWNAQDVAAQRYKNALDNYWNGIDRTQSAQQDAWQRASTDYWNGQDLGYKNRSLNEDARQFNESIAQQNADRAEKARQFNLSLENSTSGGSGGAGNNGGAQSGTKAKGDAGTSTLTSDERVSYYGSKIKSYKEYLSSGGAKAPGEYLKYVKRQIDGVSDKSFTNEERLRLYKRLTGEG